MAKTKSDLKLSSTDLKSQFNKITASLEQFFTTKVPSMPRNAQEVLVKYGPYITLIVLILSLPPILFLLGIGGLLSPFVYLGSFGAGSGLTLSLAFLIITLILEGLAIPGLIARKLSGWNLAYYAAWLNAIYSLLNGQILSSLIFFALSMWVLFQIKPHYTK